MATVPNKINDMMIETNGQTSLFNHVPIDVDCSITSGPKVTSKTLGWGVAGIFYPQNQTNLDTTLESYPSMSIQADNANFADFSFYVSNAMVDSWLFSIPKVQNLSYWIHSTDIPYLSGIQLDTTSMDEYFPGMEKKYGQDIAADM